MMNKKREKKDTTKEMCVYTDHVELPSCLSFENPKLFSVAAQNKIQKINKQIIQDGGDRSVRLVQPIHQNAHVYFLLSPSNRSRCCR
jgi:hypothetical protein